MVFELYACSPKVADGSTVNGRVCFVGIEKCVEETLIRGLLRKILSVKAKKHPVTTYGDAIDHAILHVSSYSGGK